MKSLLLSKWAPRVLFALVLVISCWAMTIHLRKPLLGPHAFRQTQTAISAYYMAEDARMFADYITPVFGKPWRLPLELPVYQWLVARWHNLTGMPLDPSGKLVSVLVWLACLGPAWVLLRSLRFSSQQCLLALMVLLSSPLYLFWSNAFLIESTGLFFAISMVACAVRGQEMKSVPWLLACFLFGVLAILCKVTTWAPAVGVGGLLLVFRDGWPPWRRVWPATDVMPVGGASVRNAFVRREAAFLVAASCCLLLPLVPGKLWIRYGDSIKAANPYAREITISTLPHMVKWNFGTWEQKLDPATWQVIGQHVTDQLLVPFPLIGPFLMVLILVAGPIASPKRIPFVLVFLAGFVAGPLVFTNLYFEHSYYWCANGIWLLLAVGTALAGISDFRPDRVWPQVTAMTLAALIALAGFTVWFQRFLPILTALPTREQITENWTKPVQRVVPLGRTLLIVGHDFNPVGLYYAERKGIAQPTCAGIRFPGPEFEEAISLLGSDDKLGAAVFADALITAENEPTIAAVLRQLGMSPHGSRTAFGVLFPANDAPPPTAGE